MMKTETKTTERITMGVNGVDGVDPDVPIKKHISALRVVLNILLVLLTGLPSLIFLLFVTPYRRGYFCDDESLKYPYIANSLPTAWIAIIGFLLALIVISVCEVLRAKYWDTPSLITTVYYRRSTYYVGEKKLPRTLYRIGRYFGYFILGAGFCMMFVDVSKYTSGRLRPHFFDICKPKAVNGRDCVSNSVNQYVPEFQCYGTDDATRLKELSLSFYSGHAQFAFYTAMFVALYLEARVRPFTQLCSPVALSIVQFLFFVAAMWATILNVKENHHHNTDVVLGVIVGNLVAIVVLVFIAKIFKYSNYFGSLFGGNVRRTVAVQEHRTVNEHSIPLRENI